jgi:hypothetical protein
MDRFGYFYAQEFIEGNQRDIRVTVIGNRYAYAFYRFNRRGDFRASGSGNIGYQTEIPADIIKYCVALNRQSGFDSMCYDILFKNGSPVVVEISYGYDDRVLFEAPGYYRFTKEGELESFITGNCWPQTLWAAWIKEQLH